MSDEPKGITTESVNLVIKPEYIALAERVSELVTNMGMNSVVVQFKDPSNPRAMIDLQIFPNRLRVRHKLGKEKVFHYSYKKNKATGEYS